MSAQIKVAHSAAFDFVRYASVWEDADILCKALKPRAKGGRLLSIASSGDNALALLTLDPRQVVAADLNPAQLACVEIRIAAFRHLADRELLGFLGVEPDQARLERYSLLRKRLSPAALAWWDGHSEELAGGLIHAGKFERYLTFFGRRLLPLLQPGPWRRRLLESSDPAEQTRIFEKSWDHAVWRAFFRIFFSRRVMGALGRDKVFFAQLSGSVGEKILERTRQAFCRIPAAGNPYLQYITTGNFTAKALPLYLRPEARAIIRKRLDRLVLFQGQIQEAPGGSFDGFNLSDIFEYMSPTEHAAVYSALLKRAKPKARLAYWNLLVHRGCADPSRARRLEKVSEGLHAEDKAWFYRSFEVDEAR